MDDKRVQRALGWGSLGFGLFMFAFAGRICRALRLQPERSRPVRLAGVRDVIIGLGLLTQRHRRAWLWARSASDAVDSAWLWKTVRERAEGAGRRAVVATGGAGLTLLDVVEARRLKTLHGQA